MCRYDCSLRVGAGRQWMLGLGISGYFHAALPPNSPICAGRGGETDYPGGNVPLVYGAHVAASSYHVGGVNVTLGDASGRFISETVNTGNLTRSPNSMTGTGYHPGAKGVSAYGVWGAMGSRDGGESSSLP